MTFLKTLQTAKQQQQKLIAVLIDPDKISANDVFDICIRINKAPVDFLFLGGSVVSNQKTEMIAKEIKKYLQKTMVLFPGDYTHLTNHADALLFLSLLSGNNPEYLVHQQVKSVPFLMNSSLEIIPTAYLLIDGGTQTSTLKVSQTKAICQTETNQITHTAKASEYMGQKLLYLEAGSGALKAVKKKIITATYDAVNIPIIVGGGIKSLKMAEQAHQAGATLVVIGTAFENEELF